MGVLRAVPAVALAVAAATVSFAETPARDAFRALDTPHFHISYNTGEIFARKRAELFEELYDRLTEFFVAKGFAVETTRSRMQVVLVSTRREFEARAGGVELALPGAIGVYLVKQRRTVFFNKLTDPEYLEQRRR